MRIPSGVVDQYVYFKAVDTTDLTTPETGLASPTNKFRVHRSRNGGVWTDFTTPTINATDTGAALLGYYELLMDEDTTIDAGDFSQNMLIHIVDTGGRMEPVALVIELYRPPGGDTGQLNVNVSSIADTGMNERFARIQSDVDTGLRIHIDDLDTGLHAHISDVDTGLHAILALQDTGAVATAVWAGDTGLRDHITNVDTGLTNRLGIIGFDVDTGLRAQISDVDTGIHAVLALQDTGAVATAVWAGDTGLRDHVTNVDTGLRTAVADAVWDEARAGHVIAGSFGEYTPGNVTHWLGTVVETPGTAGIPSVDIKTIDNNSGAATTFGRFLQAGTQGTADSGTTTTLTDTVLSSATTTGYVGYTLVIRSGTNANCVATITSFNPATDTITFTPAMPSAIDATSNYVVVPLGVSTVEAWLRTAAATPTVAGIPKVEVDTGALVRAIFEAPRIDGRKFEEAQRLQTSVLGGKVSGAGTGTEVFSRTDAATARITATVDSDGNRTAITYALDT